MTILTEAEKIARYDLERAGTLYVKLEEQDATGGENTALIDEILNVTMKHRTDMDAPCTEFRCGDLILEFLDDDPQKPWVYNFGSDCVQLAEAEHIFQNLQAILNDPRVQALRRRAPGLLSTTKEAYDAAEEPIASPYGCPLCDKPVNQQFICTQCGATIIPNTTNLLDWMWHAGGRYCAKEALKIYKAGHPELNYRRRTPTVGVEYDEDGSVTYRCGKNAVYFDTTWPKITMAVMDTAPFDYDDVVAQLPNLRALMNDPRVLAGVDAWPAVPSAPNPITIEHLYHNPKKRGDLTEEPVGPLAWTSYVIGTDETRASISFDAAGKHKPSIDIHENQDVPVPVIEQMIANIRQLLADPRVREALEK